MGDAADLYDLMYGDEDEVTCRTCGEEGLHWDYDAEGNFRLKDEDGEFHVCDLSFMLPNLDRPSQK